ncbi:hypothetical protein HAX42_13225 [Enterococcus casseliflavus]|nr:hypothetical protein [Enterococcus casseliflavus]
MKFFKRLLALLIPVLVLFCNAPEGEALSFAEAPTLNDYVNIRGSANLYRVLFGLTFLHFSGSQVATWDEIEAIGERGTVNSTFDQIASFIADQTFQVQLTKFGFGLIMSQLKTEYAVVDKNYFDDNGYYIPLSQQTALGRGGVFIDFANLFDARNIFVTAQPLANGYEYRGTDLWVNRIDVTIDSAAFANSANELFLEIASSPDKHSNSSFRQTSVSGSVVTFETTGAGMTRSVDFGRIDVNIYESLSGLKSILGLGVNVRIGDMSKTLKGLLDKSFPLDSLQFGKVLQVNPDAVLDRDGTGAIDLDDVVTEKPSEGAEDGSWWGKLVNWLFESLVTPIVVFFDWLKDLLIPDFTGIAERLDRFLKFITEKFSGLGEVMNLFSSFFVSEKSLHDLTVVWLDGKKYAVFPREYTAVFFVNIRRGVNVLIFMMTGIYIWKKVTGEGDAIAT